MDPTPVLPLHPLATDTQVVKSTLLDALYKISPRHDIITDLTDLVLEGTDAAKQVCATYLADRPATGESDLTLTKSILATIVLHQQGLTFSAQNLHDNPLYWEATRPYGDAAKGELLTAYHLNRYEALAIDAYSDANKNLESTNGEPNPHYMGASTGNWGHFQDGWDALSSALCKLPCLGKLGLVLTTYRAPRVQKSIYQLVEMEKLTELKVGAVLSHGVTIMDMGQLHFLSTAVTYNSHWDRGMEVGGLIAITGYSGVYINPFGMNGWIDGAEILYPPRICTVYEGVRPWGYQPPPPNYDREPMNPNTYKFPVAHLREISPKEMEPGQPRYEDSQFVVLASGDNRLDPTKLAMVESLDRDYDESAVIEALRRLNLAHKGLMYLTLNDLVRVTNYLTRG